MLNKLLNDKERIEREKEREARRMELMSLPRRLSTRVQVWPGWRFVVGRLSGVAGVVALVRLPCRIASCWRGAP